MLSGTGIILKGTGSGIEKRCLQCDNGFRNIIILTLFQKMSANTATTYGHTVNADDAWAVNGAVAEQE